MDIFLARQPIFSRTLRVHGYELLFRRDNATTAGVTDGDAATSSVILNAFAEIGLDRITGDRPAFLNLTRRFLIEEPIPFPPRRVVLEVLEDIVPDSELKEALRRLAQRGYRIALDDFVFEHGPKELLPLVDIVKVDIEGMKPQAIVEHARELRDRGVPKLLAEKVETREIMELCRSAGFDYFQGFFLCRPSTLRRRTIPSNRLALLQLIATLHRPDLEPREVEEIIGRDLSLSYKLLRYLSSPIFPTRRRVDSILTAVIYLGKRELTNWATLLAMSGAHDQPQALMVNVLIRARMCESLTIRNHLGDPITAFMTGMFSAVDAILDAPLHEIVGQLPLSREIVEALLHRRGRYGVILRCALAQEEGDWQTLEALDFPRAEVTAVYLEAIQWADLHAQTMEQIH